MCANCGCGIAEDKHGDERNITWNEITAAAQANDQTPQQTIANMSDMAKKQATG